MAEGLTRCKDCTREWQRERRQKDPELARKYSEAFRKKNPTYHQAWRAKAK